MTQLNVWNPEQGTVNLTPAILAALLNTTPQGLSVTTLTASGNAVVGGTLAVTGSVTMAGLVSETSIETGITAGTTQTQAGATVADATKKSHSVDTVAVASDGVRIGIAATPGARQYFANTTTNAFKLYGLGTDTINKVASATGNSVAAANNVDLICLTAGDWRAVIDA